MNHELRVSQFLLLFYECPDEDECDRLGVGLTIVLLSYMRRYLIDAKSERRIVSHTIYIANPNYVESRLYQIYEIYREFIHPPICVIVNSFESILITQFTHKTAHLINFELYTFWKWVFNSERRYEIFNVHDCHIGFRLFISYQLSCVDERWLLILCHLRIFRNSIQRCHTNIAYLWYFIFECWKSHDKFN